MAMAIDRFEGGIHRIDGEVPAILFRGDVLQPVRAGHGRGDVVRALYLGASASPAHGRAPYGLLRPPFRADHAGVRRGGGRGAVRPLRPAVADDRAGHRDRRRAGDRLVPGAAPGAPFSRERRTREPPGRKRPRAVLARPPAARAHGRDLGRVPRPAGVLADPAGPRAVDGRGLALLFHLPPAGHGAERAAGERGRPRHPRGRLRLVPASARASTGTPRWRSACCGSRCCSPRR